MRILLMLLVSVYISISVKAQVNKTKTIYDSLFLANDWRITHHAAYGINSDSLFGEGWRDKMLEVGDKVPDFVLGKIIGDFPGKNKLSDFKVELIILDFWSTGCKSCIEGFPKMEELQRKFGEKIQILLINADESAEKIEERLSLLKKFKLPNLPIIANAKHIYPYFPYKSVPLHVWLDSSGTVILCGPARNTYEKKIQNFLAGRRITYTKGTNNAPGFVPDLPYFRIVGRDVDFKRYNSFFTPFNNNYAPSTGGEKNTNVIDSINYTRRSTFINQTIEGLYQQAFFCRLEESNASKKIIHGYRNRFLLNVYDSLRYSVGVGRYLVDTEDIKSRFCYEQIAPLNYSKRQCDSLMVEDLNSYFGDLYGTMGRIEKRIVPCYSLINISQKRLRENLRNNTSSVVDSITRNGKRLLRFSSYPISDAVLTSLSRETLSQIESKKIWFLLDETQREDTKMDIILPLAAFVEELRLYLKKYNFDIVTKQRNMDILVISERSR